MDIYILVKYSKYFKHIYEHASLKGLERLPSSKYVGLLASIVLNFITCLNPIFIIKDKSNISKYRYSVYKELMLEQYDGSLFGNSGIYSWQNRMQTCPGTFQYSPPIVILDI